MAIVWVLLSFAYLIITATDTWNNIGILAMKYRYVYIYIYIMYNLILINILSNKIYND